MTNLTKKQKLCMKMLQKKPLKGQSDLKNLIAVDFLKLKISILKTIKLSRLNKYYMTNFFNTLF